MRNLANMATRMLEYFFLFNFIFYSCKFIHSIEDYLNQKPQDIGDICSVFNYRGWCRSGWKCRWLSGHLIKPTSDVKTWSLIADHNVGCFLVRWLMFNIIVEDGNA